MKLNKKFILTFILFLAIVLFFNINNIFAIDYDSSHYIQYISTSSGHTYRICANEDFYMYPEYASGSYYLSPFSISTNERIPINLYKNGSLQYNNISSQVIGFNGVPTVDLSSYSVMGNVILYTDSTLENAFFTAPVSGVVIPALETAEQIPQGITSTLQILIPVGLVVLGIGLVIYLIKRVIYLSR